MSRRRFRPLNMSGSPTHDSLTRRNSHRRTFRQLQGGKSIPPVPFPGNIYRHLTCEAITDTEALSDTNWSTGNFYESYARNFGTNTDVFGGVEWAMYYKTFDIASGSGVAEWTMQPLRFTVKEPATTGGDFEHWRIKEPDAYLIGTEALSEDNISSPVLHKRTTAQALCSSTLLPISGNSHVSDGVVTSVDIPIARLYTSCIAHLYNSLYSVAWPLLTPGSFGTPRRSVVFVKHAQYYLNGTPVGPLHDFGTWQRETIPAQWNQTRIMHPMPAAGFDYASEDIENWNLDFTAGDEIQVDVWLKVMAVKEATSKRLIVPIPRYCTANNATTSDPAGSGAPIGTLQRRDFGRQTYIRIGGVDMANGFNPDAHTFLFEAQDGTFDFGKAESGAGTFRFLVDSRHLEWVFTAGGETECGGTSTYQVQEVEAALQWVLIENNCVGGGTPVAPTSEPSEAGIEETTACDCSTAPPSGTWEINLELRYDEEMAYMAIQYTLDSVVVGTVYYRPESTGDYVDEVEDRWEGTINAGPTGVFDHLGSTTFKRWNGTQAPPYDSTLYNELADYETDIPTEILVTKVAK